MPSTCKFTFDRPNPVFYSGETINGRITLRTTKEKTVRGVYIIFEAAAKLRWEEHHSSSRVGKTKYSTVHFYGNETYLYTQTCVFGEGTLPPGIHEYTFSIPLPKECPTSCTEKYGKISYEITLRIQRPLRFDNEFDQPLSVIKQLNLNSSPEYLIPLKGEDIKYFCCWPCSSGPVISTLTIPFGGWAPGQEITYKLEVDNQSSAFNLIGTRLKLVQIYKFKADSPHRKTRSHENTLAQVEQENRTVLRSSKCTFEGKLRIPPVPPTTVGRSIITVSYRIEMYIHTGDYHKDCKIWTPIIIGTMPLAQTATNPDYIMVLPLAPPSPDTPDSLDMPPRYDICMPPTFEEATHIGEKFKDTDKNDYQNQRTGDWIPQYPMYNNFSLPTAPPTDIIEQADVMENQTLLSADFNTNMPPSAPNASP